MDEIDINIEPELVNEAEEWLYTANRDQILKYSDVLEKYDHAARVAFCNELLENFRIRKRNIFQRTLQSNLHKILTEPDQLECLDLIVQGATTAVIVQRYAQENPEIQILGQIGEEVIHEIQHFYTGWDNYFLLVSAPQYRQYAVFFKSLMGAGYTQDLLNGYTQQAETLLNEIVAFTDSQGYAVQAFPASLASRIKSFLELFGFIPKDEAQELSELSDYTRDYTRLVELLTTIQYLTKFISILNEGISQTQAQKSLNELSYLLWDQLALDQEVKAIADRTVAFMGRKVGYDQTAAQLFTQLNKIFSQENLETGEAEALLKAYFSQLSYDQAQYFLKILRIYLVNSAITITILEPVDIESLLERIERGEGRVNQADFIQSILPGILPEYWPAGEALITIMIEYFSK
jgi:hypothetical protein